MGKRFFIVPMGVLVLCGAVAVGASIASSTPKSSSSKSSSHSSSSSTTHSTHSTSGSKSSGHTTGHTSSSTSKSAGTTHSTTTGATPQFKNGPHPAGAQTVSSQVMAKASRTQQHLHLHEWHHWHHWYHHWWWGAVVVLPASNSGLVTSVPNGNTLSVLDAGNVPRRVRLAGVAAPVAGQPFFS